MKPFQKVSFFLRNESGEVTIGWLVITAAIVGMSVAVLSSIGDGTQELSGKVGDEMADREIATSF